MFGGEAQTVKELKRRFHQDGEARDETGNGRAAAGGAADTPVMLTRPREAAMPLRPTVSDLALGELRPSERLAKLGRALIALSRDLAECRQENTTLRRENAELRQRRFGRAR